MKVTTRFDSTQDPRYIKVTIPDWYTGGVKTQIRLTIYEALQLLSELKKLLKV